MKPKLKSVEKRSRDPDVAHKHVRTSFAEAGGLSFAYRDLGPEGGVPVICLNHLAAVLDNFDPRIIDGIAAKHRIITFDYRGVGASTGKAAVTVEEMAQDAITFIRALGFAKVDLLGFSLGGFVAQVIASREPQLVRKLILTGTGPAGGVGIDKVTKITLIDMLKGAVTFKDPKYYLFFTGSKSGRDAARQFLRRLKERTKDRDKEITVPAFVAQLKAVKSWGKAAPQDLSSIPHPTLVANGDQDKMVPTSNSVDLAKRLPKAELVLYPEAGHGGIFQFHGDFVNRALQFLKA
jgi:pimeloyl-ACP methyl ester carboxylesterase